MVAADVLLVTRSAMSWSAGVLSKGQVWYVSGESRQPPLPWWSVVTYSDDGHIDVSHPQNPNPNMGSDDTATISETAPQIDAATTPGTATSTTTIAGEKGEEGGGSSSGGLEGSHRSPTMGTHGRGGLLHRLRAAHRRFSGALQHGGGLRSAVAAALGKQPGSDAYETEVVVATPGGDGSNGTASDAVSDEA